MLSGFLLASIYGKSDFAVRKYAISRVFRIYPLWAAFLILNLIFAQLTGYGPFAWTAAEAGAGLTATLLTLLCGITFTSWALIPGVQTPISGGWSIEAEVAHYLLYPLVRVKSNVTLLFIISLCGLGAALVAALANPAYGLLGLVSSRFSDLGIFSTFPFFVAGILLARSRYFATRQYSFQTLKHDWRRPTISLITGLIALGCMVLLFQRLPFGSVAEAFVTCAIALILSLLINRVSRIRPLFKYIAKYSFFMYFCHFYVVYALILGKPILMTVGVVHSIMLGPWAYPLLTAGFVLCTIACTAALGAVSYRLLESPFMTIGRKLSGTR